MIIKNGLVFTESCQFESTSVVLSNQLILGLHSDVTLDDPDCYDATDCYVIPGLTDIHFHGCMGYDFCDGTDEALHAIASYELKQGVTTICPATMTLPKETLLEICQTAAAYKPSAPEATLCGINLEGPFLSRGKCGAQNADYLTTPDANLLLELIEASHELIKLVSIAPEENGAIDCITALKDKVSFSLAHTTSDYDTAIEALKSGAKHITHLYNAMPAFSHREPGVIGAAFDAPACMVELICDGIHIHPTVVRATFQLFGDHRVILISDSMMACGMPNGNYSLGGQDVTVTDSVATLANGTIAGSATHLMDCMRQAVKMGIPLESAIKAATINPARSIGIDSNYGSISAGKVANLVILRKDLSIKAIIFEGTLLSL